MISFKEYYHIRESVEESVDSDGDRILKIDLGDYQIDLLYPDSKGIAILHFYPTGNPYTVDTLTGTYRRNLRSDLIQAARILNKEGVKRGWKVELGDNEEQRARIYSKVDITKEPLSENNVREAIQTGLKKIAIENLLPDKDNMEVAVDSLHKGRYSSDKSPITAYKVKGKYVVADGHHRLLQAIINGEASMNVKILPPDHQITRNGTIKLDFYDGDYYGLDSSLENGWLINRL